LCLLLRCQVSKLLVERQVIMVYFVIFLGGWVKCDGGDVCAAGQMLEVETMAMALAHRKRLMGQYNVPEGRVCIIRGQEIDLEGHETVQQAAERGFRS
jgi:hypothetical protein